jgi:FkbM family methyltransferase
VTRKQITDALVLRALSRHLRMRILSGPNQSLWWSLATSRRFLTGRFERTRVDAVADLIRPCECFWDVGAHQGYVALLASRRVTPSGSVYAFEPFPKNLWYLRHHVAWNRLRNVTVLPIAVGLSDRTESFQPRGSARGHLVGTDGEGALRVSVRSMDSLIAAGECAPPDSLKVDIEGGEIDFLNGAEKSLRGKPILMVLAVHSPDLRDRSIAILEDYGYAVYQTYREMPADGNWEAEKNSDPDILAIGPGREVAPDLIEAFRQSTG